MVRGKTATTFVDATRPPPLEPGWITAFLMEPATESPPSVSGTATAKSIMKKATHTAPIIKFMVFLFPPVLVWLNLAFARYWVYLDLVEPSNIGFRNYDENVLYVLKSLGRYCALMLSVPPYF